MTMHNTDDGSPVFGPYPWPVTQRRRVLPADTERLIAIGAAALGREDNERQARGERLVNVTSDRYEVAARIVIEALISGTPDE